MENTFTEIVLYCGGKNDVLKDKKFGILNSFVIEIEGFSYFSWQLS
jgi:hypothetical protein